MNIKTRCALVALVAGLPLGVRADQPAAEQQNEHTWAGTVSSVSSQDHTLRVKGWLESKTFNLGEKCAITAREKEGATLNDLRPGNEVRIRYQNVDGVLVADTIAEKPLGWTGAVEAADPKAGTVTMAEAPLYRPFRKPTVFRIAGDCKVLLSMGNSGTFADLQSGDRVTIHYELQDGSRVAYRIRQKTATFVGTIDAIEISARTVRVKDLSGEKRFELAHQCRILLPGPKTGHVKELALGQKYQFTYERVNGINVLDRIAPALPATSPQTASTR